VSVLLGVSLDGASEEADPAAPPHLVPFVASSTAPTLFARVICIITLRPDPISNLRPILYKQTNTPPAPRNPAFPPRKQPVPRPAHHSPRSEASLSLAAFQHGTRQAPQEVFYRKDEFPRQGDETEKTKEYRLVREALDEYNQAFWVRRLCGSACGRRPAQTIVR
jgi:hypothetical protein